MVPFPFLWLAGGAGGGGTIPLGGGGRPRD